MCRSAYFRLFMYRYFYNLIDKLQILKNMKQIQPHRTREIWRKTGVSWDVVLYFKKEKRCCAVHCIQRFLLYTIFQYSPFLKMKARLNQNYWIPSSSSHVRGTCFSWKICWILVATTFSSYIFPEKLRKDSIEITLENFSGPSSLVSLMKCNTWLFNGAANVNFCQSMVDKSNDYITWLFRDWIKYLNVEMTDSKKMSPVFVKIILEFTMWPTYLNIFFTPKSKRQYAVWTYLIHVCICFFLLSHFLFLNMYARVR